MGLHREVAVRRLNPIVGGRRGHEIGQALPLRMSADMFDKRVAVNEAYCSAGSWSKMSPWMDLIQGSSMLGCGSRLTVVTAAGRTSALTHILGVPPKSRHRHSRRCPGSAR